MRRFLFLFISCLWFSCVCLAQEKEVKLDSIELQGKLVDSFTREVIDSVWIELYRMPDSVMVDTLYNYREHMMKMWGWEYPVDGFNTKVPTHGKYMIYAAKKGYKPFFHAFEIPRKRYNKKVREWDLDELLMYKAGSTFLDRDLDEITVKATRVKMVMHGDTVVYNADAFQLSEGSMLDALVRQLPGVEIRKGGEIYINGEKVQELLVNGKDFFKGDAKVALENLPAYTVQNIKAYQREGKQAYLDKHHDAMKKKDPWVLDVGLKREYAKGWLGNVEAGYGWDNRYMGRIFGIRYTDHSRITLFANANNTNDNSRPGDQTSWTDYSSPTSEIRSVNGGFDLHVDGKVTKTELNTSINGGMTDTDSQTDQSSQTFLQGGDVWSRSRSVNDSRSGNLNWYAGVDFRKKELYANIGANAGFSKGRNHGTNRSATFSQDPLDAHRGASLDSVFAPLGSPRLLAFLTNRSEDQTFSRNRSGNGGLNAMIYTVAPWNGETVYMNVSENYSASRSEDFSHYDLRQTGSPQDFRNRYTESPHHSNNFNLSLNHQLFSYKDVFTMGLSYGYSNSYSDSNRDLFRLDDFSEWSAGTGHALGSLPSMRDSLQLCIDARNSYNSITHNQTHDTRLSVSGGGEWGYYSVDAGFNRKNDRMEDTREGKYQDLSDRYTLWNFGAQGAFKKVRAGVHYSQSAPGLSQKLDVRDDSNPLYVSLGNPNLRNTFNASYDLSYSRFSQERQYSWSVGVGFSHGSNIGMAQTYNRETGVYTTQPRNVKGNHSSSLYLNFSLPLDKQKLLTLSWNNSMNYSRSVDFSSDNPAVLDPNVPETDFPLSKVYNLSASEWMTLEYKKNDYAVSANAEADFSHAQSQREGFTTINTVDYSYGFSARLGFNHGYQLGTDITMHSRRGYEDHTMNDNNLVWNLSLSKSFFKSRCMVLKVTGHDILQQLDNVRRSINAQGRSETWYNTQPSYVLLTASYRLDMKPRKKGQ